MSQNLKIVLSNVDKQTPNNVGFSDTITIKRDSKIALTSFNASFDINKLGQDILGQSFIMNLNETLYNDPRTITIPDKTYYNETELNLEITKQINKSFSAYEKNASANQKRVFTGYGISLVNNNDISEITGLGSSVNKDKIVIALVVYPSVDIPLAIENYPEYTIDGNGELTTGTEGIDFTHQYNMSTFGTSGGALSTDTYLAKGGGVAFQYNLRFNLKNQTLTSFMKLQDQNGDYMSLNYNTENRAGGDKPIVYFYVEKKISGVITTDYIGNEFYNYDSIVNDNSQTINVGPWSQTEKTKSESYFLWCVRDGNWIIVYYDANDSTYHEIYTNGNEYKISDNYTFVKGIQQASQKQVVYYANQTKGTLQGTPTTGSATIKTTFNFENATRLREIYSFGVVGLMQPENTLPCQYTPNGEVDFYPKQNFELACEIDTIKIKNYVGTKGNVDAGRKNIISYFTPSSTISQSSFIYSFDPSSPIYLAVDNKQDIDFNSMNIRFINTYSNKTFSADTITCVLTNSPI